MNFLVLFTLVIAAVNAYNNELNQGSPQHQKLRNKKKLLLDRRSLHNPMPISGPTPDKAQQLSSIMKGASDKSLSHSVGGTQERALLDSTTTNSFSASVSSSSDDTDSLDVVLVSDSEDGDTRGRALQSSAPMSPSTDSSTEYSIDGSGTTNSTSTSMSDSQDGDDDSSSSHDSTSLSPSIDSSSSDSNDVSAAENGNLISVESRLSASSAAALGLSNVLGRLLLLISLTGTALPALMLVV